MRVLEYATDSGPECKCGFRIWYYVATMDELNEVYEVDARCVSCHRVEGFEVRTLPQTSADMRAAHAAKVKRATGNAS